MDKLLWNTEEEEELFIIYSFHTNEVFANPQYDILCTKDVLWSWPSSNRIEKSKVRQTHLFKRRHLLIDRKERRRGVY